MNGQVIINGMTIKEFESWLRTVINEANSNIKNKERYGNARKASKIFGVSPNTIINWANAGHFPSYPKGGTTLYSYQEIEEYIRNKSANEPQKKPQKTKKP